MSDGTAIQWASATANPIRARGNEDGKQGWICTRVSPACTNCYASDMNQNRYYGTGHEYTVPNLARVTPYLEPKVVQQVISWRKPREIFWCSMTDLFGEWVPDAWIDQVFATIALTPHHRHIVLTKRAERAADYLGDTGLERLIGLMAHDHQKPPCQGCEHLPPPPWPPPNTIIGASVENQEWADKRRPAMERIAQLGWPTWVSNEPGLGPIDWTGWEFTRWMVSGGESGSKAKVRPYALEWARQSRDWCAANGVPWFCKQLGSAPFEVTQRVAGIGVYPSSRAARTYRDDPVLMNLKHHKGGAIDEWPADLRVREMPV